MVAVTLLRTLVFLGTVGIAAHAAPVGSSYLALGEMVRHRSPGWDEVHHAAHYRRWERIEVGEMVRHRSPGWDEVHHAAHYRRWERIEMGDSVVKRDGGVVRRLFREGTGLKRDGGLEFAVSVRLMPRDQQRVREVLREANDPAHERFRKFLSHDQAMELLSPHPDAVEMTHEFLRGHGIEQHHVNRTDDGQTWSFWVGIEKANQMFDADFAVHKYVPRGIAESEGIRGPDAVLYQLGTAAYSLPAKLAPFVGYVNPGSDFRQVRPHIAKRAVKAQEANRTVHSDAVHFATPHGPPMVSGLKGCDVLMTPACLRAIYHMPAPNAGSTAGVSVATLNLRPYQSNPDNLKAGFERYGDGRIPKSYLPEKIDIDVPGVSQSTDEANHSEPDLDIELMVPLVYPMKFYDFQAPSLSAMSLYGAVAQMGQSGTPRPDVLSVSYGASECSAECETYYCDMTNGVALQGTTLLASSGDNGNQDIQDPALCPNWIAVGATQTKYGSTVTSLQIVSDNERGWSFDSAGGFSTATPPQDWQRGALEAYTKKHLSEVFGFLQTNAGVPDLSAQGKEFLIAITILGAQSWYTYGGTSASTPIASALMALVNGALKQAKAPLLGNPLPTFYSNTTLFRDVVAGNNNIDGFSGDWPAKSGWDPASGLGTPLYDRILAHFLA